MILILRNRATFVGHIEQLPAISVDRVGRANRCGLFQDHHCKIDSIEIRDNAFELLESDEAPEPYASGDPNEALEAHAIDARLLVLTKDQLDAGGVAAVPCDKREAVFKLGFTRRLT